MSVNYFPFNGPLGSSGSSALANLTDVYIPAPQDKQVLMYNAATGKWNAVSGVQIFGIYPIVITATGGVNNTVGFPLFHTGNGPPSIAAPIGDLWDDQTNGLLYQAKTYTAGAAGLHTLQIQDGAIHIYKMDDANGTIAYDSGVGPLLNGTYSGGVTRVAAMSADQGFAAQFNGTTGQLALPAFAGDVNSIYDPPNWLNSGNFSMEIYFHSNAGGAVNTAIMGGQGPGGASGNFPQLDYAISSGNTVTGNTTVGTTINNGGLNPTLNAPNQLVIVFDRTLGQLRVYINGALSTNNSFTPGGSPFGTYIFSGPIYVGYRVNANSFGAITIQSLAFYGSALTGTQVSNHWNSLGATGASTWAKFVQEPLLQTGAGAPAYVAPAGSLYSRTDGAAGTHLYFSNGAGVWTALV